MTTEKNKFTEHFACTCCKKSITMTVRKQQRDTITKSKEAVDKLKLEQKNLLGINKTRKITIEYYENGKTSSLIHIKCPHCAKYLSCWINQKTGEVKDIKEDTEMNKPQQMFGNLRNYKKQWAE